MRSNISKLGIILLSLIIICIFGFLAIEYESLICFLISSFSLCFLLAFIDALVYLQNMEDKKNQNSFKEPESIDPHNL